jgi:hypothetical protein
MGVPAGSLAFSYVQVPIVYALTPDEAWIRVTHNDGMATERPGCRLTLEESRALLERRGGIARIEVGVPERSLIAS